MLRNGLISIYSDRSSKPSDLLCYGAADTASNMALASFRDTLYSIIVYIRLKLLILG
jgi:hypothetical protein